MYRKKNFQTFLNVNFFKMVWGKDFQQIERKKFWIITKYDMFYSRFERFWVLFAWRMFVNTNDQNIESIFHIKSKLNIWTHIKACEHTNCLRSKKYQSYNIYLTGEMIYTKLRIPILQVMRCYYNYVFIYLFIVYLYSFN